MNAHLALIAVLLLAPDRAAAQDDDTLSVPLPEDILALPGSARAAFHAVVGTRLVDGLVGDASVLFDAPAAECERVLMLCGPHARWAHRAADGTWTWDSAGFVVAGKLPEKFKGAYVDVLRAADGQLAPPLDAVYPTFTSDETAGLSFVIGVPAAGRYELVLDAARGRQRGLATCEALPEEKLDPAQLPDFTVRPAEFRLALSVPSKFQRSTPVLSLKEIYPRMKLDASANAVRSGAGLSVPISPRVLAGRLWAWAPGWRVLRVDGREFTEAKPAVSRLVEAGHKLLLRVRNPAGEAIEIACAQLRDEQGESLVAAWDPRGDENAAQLDSVGRVSASGEVTLFGLPAGGVRISVGRCGAEHEPVVVTWDGKKDVLEVVLD